MREASVVGGVYDVQLATSTTPCAGGAQHNHRQLVVSLRFDLVQYFAPALTLVMMSSGGGVRDEFATHAIARNHSSGPESVMVDANQAGSQPS
jgi:hypothetical protein